MRIKDRLFRSMFFNRTIILSCVLFVLFFMLVGCRGTYELESGWKDREISVDGESEDWLGLLMYIQEVNVSLGLLNDQTHMYLCMIAEDPFIRTQVMGRGFTVWFDPKGGNEKTFGIRFPLGMQGQPGKIGFMDPREGGWERERIRGDVKPSMDELEILGPGEDMSHRIPIKEVKGIDICLEVSSGLIVYELKVPLARSEENPYAIETEAGRAVGIGLETPKIDMNEMRKRMQERMPEGGGRGEMGGMRGGGGRPMGSRGFQKPKDLKVWAVVQLASNESSI